MRLLTFADHRLLENTEAAYKKEFDDLKKEFGHHVDLMFSTGLPGYIESRTKGSYSLDAIKQSLGSHDKTKAKAEAIKQTKDKVEEQVHFIAESESRHCAYYKAKDNKWYMELADNEHGTQDDATTYGPFDDQEAANDYLHANFSNPGGSMRDDSGKREVPTDVTSPRRR